MKKKFAIIIVLFLLVIGSVYVFIPSKLFVNNIAVLQCSTSGANRIIAQKDNWKKFWKGSQSLTQSSSFSNADLFIYNNDTFRVTKLSQNAMSIGIADDNTNVNSTLQILQLPKDSIALDWGYETHTSVNPFTRIRQYQDAVRTKENMKVVLSQIERFLSKNENIYGLSIGRTTTKDTLLISTKSEMNLHPTTGQVYSMIGKLQAYAKEKEALQTGYPMLNITQTDTQHFSVMTALPVNKKLESSNEITYKRMIPGGFLVTTVTGGEGAIKSASQQMEQYFQDYRHTAMAIPFMYLITDRSKETDTTKWVTKLYYPVM